MLQMDLFALQDQKSQEALHSTHLPTQHTHLAHYQQHQEVDLDHNKNQYTVVMEQTHKDLVLDQQQTVVEQDAVIQIRLTLVL